MNNIKLVNIPTRSEISIYENRVNTYRDYENTAKKVLWAVPGIALICCFIIMEVLFLNKNSKGALIVMIVTLALLLYQVFLSSGMINYVTEQMTGITAHEKMKRQLQLENYRILEKMEQFEADNKISGSSISFDLNSKTLSIKIKTADELSGGWEGNVKIDKWSTSHRTEEYIFDFEDNLLIIPGGGEDVSKLYRKKVQIAAAKKSLKASGFNHLSNQEKEQICGICIHAHDRTITQEKLDSFCNKCFL